MSLAHFDDISDICNDFEKNQQFGNEFRLRDVRNKKTYYKTSALSKSEISKRLILV